MAKTYKTKRCAWFAGCRQMATATAYHTFQKKIVRCCARCRRTNEYLVDVPAAGGVR